MRRTSIVIALVALFALGGGLIAVTAYQIGVGTAVTTAVTQSGGTVVAPVGPAYGYGWGWGHGFGLFGFLGFLLLVFLFIGLLRAIAFGGRRHRWDGPGGPGGWGGPGDPRHERWEGRAREVFDDFHRRAHESDTKPPTG